MSSTIKRTEILHLSDESSAIAWLLEHWAVIRAGRRLIVACVAVVVALAWLYLAIASPSFLATAQLVVNSNEEGPFRQIPVSVGSGEVELAAIDDNVQIIESDAVLRHVVRKLDLTHDQVFQSFGRSISGAIVGPVLQVITSLVVSPSVVSVGPDEAAETRSAMLLHTLVDVKRQATSKVINITVRTPNAIRSAELANAVADAYLEEEVTAKRRVAEDAKAWLDGGIATVRHDAVMADQAVQAFRDEHRLVDTTDHGPVDDQKLLEFNNSLTAAHARTEEAEARAAQIDTVLNRGLDDSTVTDTLNNSVLVKIRTDYITALDRMTQLRKQYGSGHGLVLRAEQDVANLRNAATEELRRIGQSYHNDAVAARASEAAMQREYERLVTESGDKSRIRVELHDLGSSADTYRTLYASYLQRYTQAIQDQAFPVPRSRVFSRAMAPLKPVLNVPLVLFTAAVLGGVIGTGGVLVGAAFDRRIAQAAQLERATGIECIGVFGDVGKTGESAAASMLKLFDQSAGVTWREEIFTVAARLVMGRQGADFGLAVGLISTQAGEGKTTLSFNLAEALASSGYRTLMVDLDMRSRDLTKAVIGSCQLGVVRALDGTVAMAELVRSTQTKGLYILPCEALGAHEHPSQLLSSRIAAALLDLRKDYDFIIYDLPSLADSAATAFAQGYIDAFLYVVQANKTKSDVLCDRIAHAGFLSDRIAGMLLNRIAAA